MQKIHLNKGVMQLYWDHTSVWVVSCKFAVYFQIFFCKNMSRKLLLLVTPKIQIISNFLVLSQNHAPCPEVPKYNLLNPN